MVNCKRCNKCESYFKTVRPIRLKESAINFVCKSISNLTAWLHDMMQSFQQTIQTPSSPETFGKIQRTTSSRGLRKVAFHSTLGYLREPNCFCRG